MGLKLKQDKQYKTVYFSKKIEVDLDDKREFSGIITTDSVDHDNEVLLPDGIQLSTFNKNPIILFNHDYEHPIGKSLDLRQTDNGWEATAKIAEKGSTTKADEVWSLVKQGILKGISVGYIELEKRIPSKKDILKFGDKVRAIVSKWKLIEFSIVSAPCNQDALIISCKNLKIDPKNILGNDYVDKNYELEVEVEIEKLEDEIDIKIEKEVKDKIIKVIKNEEIKGKKINIKEIMTYFLESMEEIKKYNKGELF